jgi:hypothetical protein
MNCPDRGRRAAAGRKIIAGRRCGKSARAHQSPDGFGAEAHAAVIGSRRSTTDRFAAHAFDPFVRDPDDATKANAVARSKALVRCRATNRRSARRREAAMAHRHPQGVAIL